MKLKTIKRIGLAATILGGITSIVASWAGDKAQDAAIDEKLNNKFNEFFGFDQPTAKASEIMLLHSEENCQ